MSLSEANKCLVVGMTNALMICYPQISLVADVQKASDDATPRKIGDFRPDMYALLSVVSDSVLLTETKTRKGIDNEHAYAQVAIFLGCLGRRRNTCVFMPDELDFWQLDQVTGRLWRLD